VGGIQVRFDDGKGSLSLRMLGIIFNEKLRIVVTANWRQFQCSSDNPWKWECDSLLPSRFESLFAFYSGKKCVGQAERPLNVCHATWE